MSIHRPEQFARMVRDTLRRCRIPELYGADFAKPYTTVGMICEYTVSNSGRGYWIIGGLVPLSIAKVLYADPLGRDDVRVCGHCACPPPEEWLTYRTNGGMQVISSKDKAEGDRLASAIPSFLDKWESTLAESVVDDEPTKYNAFVEGYHIDSEAGLRFFADTIREHCGFMPFPLRPSQGEQNRKEQPHA